jgi:Protein of unknown function (DUF1549)
MFSDSRTIAVFVMIASAASARGDDEHWAFVPPRRHAPPEVRDGAQLRDPLDAFVLARLEAAGIEPSPPADSRTLARRVALDLTGLPPSTADVAAIVGDPARYDRYVDELLASPPYGERMATMWLDLARYADTVGYHGDQNLHAFPYRDWVVDAFNANMPFDRFTLAQIAGDLLPNATVADHVASGFNRLNMVTREGGAQPGEYLAKYAADRVRTVATTWLGSTLGCAECHDHKYDPFTIRDFYSFAAFFADVKQWGVYTTYAYTPNPDLPGFTNDHPFPPEIEVDVPYLAERARRIRAQAAALAVDSGATIAADAARLAEFEAWRAETGEFLAREPDAFTTSVPRVLEPDGAGVRDDGSVVLPADASKALRLEIAATPPRVAAIELELLPDASHGESILRRGAGETTVQLALAVQPNTSVDPDAKPKPVKLRAAESDRALPRYSNGHALRGVAGGWRVAAQDRFTV